jgi:hypothetical protein
MTEADSLLIADACACNTSAPDPDTPIDPSPPGVPPAPLVALVAGAMTLRRDHDTLVKIIGNRKVRTLQEASAVARLALTVPPEQADALFQRIARYILRMEAEAPR